MFLVRDIITKVVYIVFAIIYIMLFVAKEDEPISDNNIVSSKQIQSLSDITDNQNRNRQYKQIQSPVSTSVHSAKETYNSAVQFLKTAVNFG